jgi:hypothetical protein
MKPSQGTSYPSLHEIALTWKKGDVIGALQARLDMFDLFNEYTGKGTLFIAPGRKSMMVSQLVRCPTIESTIQPSENEGIL